jgi:hypothetical protein
VPLPPVPVALFPSAKHTRRAVSGRRRVAVSKF